MLGFIKSFFCRIALLFLLPLNLQMAAATELCDDRAHRAANNAADNIKALIRQSKTPEAVGQFELIKSTLSSCPKDPKLMLAAAAGSYAFLSVPRQTGDAALKRVSEIDELLNQIQSTGRPSGNTNVSIFLAKEVSRLIVQIADKNGVVHPILKPGATFQSCPPMATNRAQGVWYAYKDKWDGKAAPIYLKKLADACASERTPFAREPQKYYADYLRAKAKRTSGPVERFELLKKAEKAMAIHGTRDILTHYERPGARLFWEEYVKAEAAATPDFNVLIRSDIFKGENDWQLAYAEALVGYHIDQIWRARYAATTQEQITAQFKRLYTDAKILQTQADAAGTKARRALYRAVVDYEEGLYRSETTKDKRTMSKKFWTFLNPYTE